MNEAVGYLGSFIHNQEIQGFWNKEPGNNLLDGGAPFYRTYLCKEGGYMAVGALEPKFYEKFLEGLGL
jgi:alpha-methylacyl-CoA racemase